MKSSIAKISTRQLDSLDSGKKLYHPEFSSLLASVPLHQRVLVVGRYRAYWANASLPMDYSCTFLAHDDVTRKLMKIPMYFRWFAHTTEFRGGGSYTGAVGVSNESGHIQLRIPPLIRIPL